MSPRHAASLIIATLLCWTIFTTDAQRHHPSSQPSDPTPSPTTDGGDTQLTDSLRCPVCDYSVVSIVRKVISHELYCRLFTPYDLSVNVSLGSSSQCQRSPTRNGLETDETRLHISSTFVVEALLDVCKEDILTAFPATEVLYSSDPSENGKQSRREVYNQLATKPIPRRFSSTIQAVCRTGYSRRLMVGLANFITEEVMSIAWSGVDDISSALRSLLEANGGDLPQKSYLELVTLQERESIYQAIVRSQRRACVSACGDIPRPTSLTAPRAAGFDMFGQRVRIHEHLTFDEAEALRAA